MAASCQSVVETLADVVARRPVLTPVLKAFEPLLEACASLPAALGPLLREGGPRLPSWQGERAAQGVSLLSDASLPGIEAALHAAAETVLPLLAQQKALRPYAATLRGFFRRAPASRPAPQSDGDDGTGPRALAESMLRGETRVLESCGAALDVPPEVLAFALDPILGPVLRALVETAGYGENAPAPWDAEGAWTQGYCPVCGSFPSIAWLERPVHDEKNAFLAGGGGKKHLHCPLCGTDWKFRRGACPACGEEGSGVMEILRESGDARGERIDWCTKCRSYYPVVDLRERDATPHPDALALGLMHLDMVAAEKKLRPLHPAFWNTF